MIFLKNPHVTEIEKLTYLLATEVVAQTSSFSVGLVWESRSIVRGPVRWSRRACGRHLLSEHQRLMFWDQTGPTICSFIPWAISEVFKLRNFFFTKAFITYLGSPIIAL